MASLRSANGTHAAGPAFDRPLHGGGVGTTDGVGVSVEIEGLGPRALHVNGHASMVVCGVPGGGADVGAKAEVRVRVSLVDGASEGGGSACDIILAFPNTYYANLEAKGRFENNAAVTKEVALMMDPSADPFAAPAPDADAPSERFGAKDANDLSWANLLNAYTCTECGRCTSECPANLTGKKLSPRKIMMDTRDRIEEIGQNIATNGSFLDDGKSLLGDYITNEELWACTSCNACVQACPVDIDPLNIIMKLRNFATMEESSAPGALNAMMTNVENNGAPWPFNQMDRANWINE